MRPDLRDRHRPPVRIVVVIGALVGFVGIGWALAALGLFGLHLRPGCTVRNDLGTITVYQRFTGPEDFKGMCDRMVEIGNSSEDLARYGLTRDPRVHLSVADDPVGGLICSFHVTLPLSGAPVPKDQWWWPAAAAPSGAPPLSFTSELFATDHNQYVAQTVCASARKRITAFWPGATVS